MASSLGEHVRGKGMFWKVDSNSHVPKPSHFGKAPFLCMFVEDGRKEGEQLFLYGGRTLVVLVPSL